MSPDLAALQRAFRGAVLGVDDNVFAGGDGPFAESLITPRGAIATRLAVYRNTVQGSLADVLATAFPAVRRIVGAPFFAALAHRFVTTAPPSVPQLSAYGKDFPEFLAAETLAGLAHGLSYLADVARLEWARGEAYFAADASPLAPADLAAVAPEQIDGLALVLHPAARLVQSEYPIHRIWQVNQPEIAEVPAVDMSVAQAVMLSRPEFRVTMRIIPAADAVFVAAIAGGAALGAAFDAALVCSPGFDGEAALRDHLIHGTFTGTGTGAKGTRA